MNGSRPATPSRRLVRRRATMIAVLAAGLLIGRAAAAQTTYGTLSNFDVFNDTGEDCHGFEIELEGVSSVDIGYTFGAPYERYGDPTVADVPGGVVIRYRSPWDAVNHVFTQATPQAPAVITPTDGHACWTGGSGNYLTSGCEHFGLGVNGNPTRTTYRWLVADPAVAGALIASGTNVSIPAPIWNVVADPAGGQPVVQAVLPPEPAEVNAQYGDAMWVKVFETEAAEPADLNHLLTDDPAVPQEAVETEVEWTILQARPNGGGNDELVNKGKAANGKESVTRRYEFYAYTGAYDPENHEAICGGDGSCDVPLDGELGNYIGAQMAAVNLAPLAPPASVQLSVSKLGGGDGSVSSAPAGIDCGVTCSASFAQDSIVTLSEVPALGSFFAGWGGACTGSNPAADVTLSAASSCSATFQLASASADLALSLNQGSLQALVGKHVRWIGKVTNLGPALAVAPTLTVSLTGLAAADLAAIKVPKQCSIAGTDVTCPLRDLKSGKKVRRVVSVKPSVAGTIDVGATVRSSTPSADPSGAAQQLSTVVK